MGQSRHIPNRLKRYRRISGYKQIEVAKILGLRSTNRLSRWEQGLSQPNIRNLMKLSSLYKTLVEELYFDVLKESRKEIDQNYKNKNS